MNLHNNLSEGVIPVIFMIIWAVMFLGIGTLIVRTIIQNVRTKRTNDSMPQETVQARVVTKRMHVWGDHSSTDYYATFEFADGSRTELEMRGEEYGMLAEGDTGLLTLQGTRYIGFQRQN